MSESVNVAPEVQSQADPPAQKPHWSISQMGMYFSCGHKYKLWYLEGQKFPSGLAALKGTGMHKAAEVNFKNVLATGEALSTPEIIAAAIEGFESRLAKDGITLTDDEASLGVDIAVGHAKDDVVNLAGAFSVYQARAYVPKHVEKFVRIPVPRGSHDLLGVLDLVTADDEVVDFKTSKRRKSSFSAAESLQLTMYAAGHAVAFGKPAKDVRLDILVQTSKGVQRQVQIDHRDQKDFQVLANRINMMDQGLKAGVFLPAAPGDWSCSAAWCPFFTRGCIYVNADRVAAAKAAEAE